MIGRAARVPINAVIAANVPQCSHFWPHRERTPGIVRTTDQRFSQPDHFRREALLF
jgi:hypothetical protein